MSREKIIAATLTAFFIILMTTPAWAGFGDAVEMTGESAAELGKDIVGLPVHLLRLAASSVWTVGEVLVFPFRAIF